MCACRRYMRSIAPKFAVQSSREAAIDDMFAQIKEDLIACEPGAVNASAAKSVVTPLYDRYLHVLEHGGYLPESGFVNGRDFPSGADLAVLGNIAIPSTCTPGFALPPDPRTLIRPPSPRPSEPPNLHLVSQSSSSPASRMARRSGMPGMTRRPFRRCTRLLSARRPIRW